MLASTATSALVFAIFNLNGGEIILILVLILFLFGAKKLPEIGQGMGEGFSELRRLLGQIPKEVNRGAHDAGESLGGIYGKPAAQALTTDNQTAELYDPAAFHRPHTSKQGRFRRLLRFARQIWLRICKRWVSLIGQRRGAH